MKRLLPVLLGIMLVLTVAVAAETTPVQFPIDGTGAFDVTYTGTPGALYALVVLEGEHTEGVAPEITEDNIQFIDQKEANSSGVVTFEDILLKDVFEKSSVYLGGTDLDEAVYLGSVAGPISIEVKVGDIIYLQDGTRVVSEDVVCNLGSTNGYVVVNSVNANGVQTSQKVYKIEDSTVTEVENYKNGAINTSVASIKADDLTKAGIRTQAKFALALKNNVKETGFVATIESPAFKSIMTAKGKDPDDYELTLDLVGLGAAVSNFAYSREAEVDRFAYLDELAGEKIVYCVVTKEGGVPLTANTVFYNVAVRPYYILEDETVIYGETTKNTIYDVAKSIKKNDPTTYAMYMDYIDTVLQTIAVDVIIPGEELFNPVG